MRNDERNSNSLVALKKWRNDVGISRTSAFRFRQRGWLKTITIAGKPYITVDALRQFVRRAESGEFARVSARRNICKKH